MGGDIYIDNEMLLVTDFVNLKIKSAQPFRYAHINRIYICLFIEVNAHKCTVFKKKICFQFDPNQNTVRPYVPKRKRRIPIKTETLLHVDN
jgi:competence protein ComGF